MSYCWLAICIWLHHYQRLRKVISAHVQRITVRDIYYVSYLYHFIQGETRCRLCICLHQHVLSPMSGNVTPHPSASSTILFCDHYQTFHLWEFRKVRNITKYLLAWLQCYWTIGWIWLDRCILQCSLVWPHATHRIKKE